MLLKSSYKIELEAILNSPLFLVLNDSKLTCVCCDDMSHENLAAALKVNFNCLHCCVALKVRPLTRRSYSTTYKSATTLLFIIHNYAFIRSDYPVNLRIQRQLLGSLCASCAPILIQIIACNPLSPNCDENEISLYIITTCSNIQVMRLKEVITKDKLS